ncbi:fluoride efflux transporter CrcB [Nocardia flavorosea]|uniref:Fluoride-specific ion channel FluC n=1 Tax=Nocardia flavorosea TaxID=53429 RepID=A0A846Y8R9_9NOCA|nr:fluoride efflux transporter CrcB [Nocardia flavorosea]NKY55247.1 fluoride efflux transporter CrcB [Nocardia flavorosea]
MSEPVQTAPMDAAVLAAVACGGGLGAGLRYWLTLRIPVRPGGFPWATFLANTLGCLAIGILMVIITEVFAPPRLLRPFLGVGVLGGFTTFSSYSAEVRTLLESGAPGVALGYLGGTVVTCLVAVLAGMTVTRWITGRRGGTRQYGTS